MIDSWKIYEMLRYIFSFFVYNVSANIVSDQGFVLWKKEHARASSIEFIHLIAKSYHSQVAGLINLGCGLSMAQSRHLPRNSIWQFGASMKPSLRDREFNV